MFTSCSRLTKSLLLAFSLLAQSAVMAQDRPFHLGGDEDEAPLGFRNERKEYIGIYADILQEAFKRMKVKCDLKSYPWLRVQYMVEHGEADGMITIPNATRDQYAVASKEHIIELEFVAFARKDNPKIQQILDYEKLSDFKDLKILDYLGDGWGEKHLVGLKVERSGNYSQSLLKLAGKRGDVAIQSRIPTLFEIKKQLLKNPSDEDLRSIVNSSKPLDSQKYYLMFSKKSPYLPLIPQFDKTIKEMRADGTLQKISAKYIQ